MRAALVQAPTIRPARSVGGWLPWLGVVAAAWLVVWAWGGWLGVAAAVAVVAAVAAGLQWRQAQAWRGLFEHGQDIALLLDADGCCLALNARARQCLGGDGQSFIGRPASAFITPATADPQGAAPAASGDAEVALRHASGSTKPALLNLQALPDGRSLWRLREQGDRPTLLQLLEQASAVTDSLDEAVMVTDASGQIVAVNPAFTAITGFTPGEALHRNLGFLLSGRHDKAFHRAVWTSLKTTGHWQGEVWNRHRSGRRFPAWQTISPVRDAAGAIVGHAWLFSDISALKRDEERLLHLAHHDPLTDLPNRRSFGHDLARSLQRARRQRQGLALLFIDLDDFKAVNDSLGHAAGDQLLRVVGERLRDTLRAEDTVARLGGDEFTVVLEETNDADAAAGTAFKLLAAICTPVALDGCSVSVSASIGIALFPGDGANADELTRAADAAMYKAKLLGRQTYAFSEPPQSAPKRRRATPVDELSRVLGAGN